MLAAADTFRAAAIDQLKIWGERSGASVVASDVGSDPASVAFKAVEAAKQYSGAEISIVWEAGLQSLDPLNFSGPKWEELTGIKVKVIEVPTAEMFTKILQEHRAGTGAYDALNVIPSWMPDLVKAGALEELDAYVDKYGFREELQKIAPTYRDNQMTVDGKIYGFPDDGDLFVLYTDGVIEARGKDGAFYGTEGLLACLERNRDADLSTIQRKIVSEVEAFASEDRLQDDTSLILIRREGAADA